MTTATSKTNKQAKELDNKTKEYVGKIESSGLGKLMPTELKEVKFKSLVLAVIIISGFYSMTLTLAFGKSDYNGIKKIFYYFGYYILLITGYCGFGVDLALFMTRLSSLLFIMGIYKSLHVVALIIMLIFKLLNGFMVNIAYELSILLNIFLVIASFYYVAIFFKRIELPEYDLDGELKKSEEDKQKTEEKKEEKEEEKKEDLDKKNEPEKEKV